jgi:hypothetical protein
MAGKETVSERHSGLRPSEKELPEQRSVTKIPLLNTKYVSASLGRFIAFPVLEVIMVLYKGNVLVICKGIDGLN